MYNFKCANNRKHSITLSINRFWTVGSYVSSCSPSKTIQGKEVLLNLKGGFVQSFHITDHYPRTQKNQVCVMLTKPFLKWSTDKLGTVVVLKYYWPVKRKFFFLFLFSLNNLSNLHVSILKKKKKKYSVFGHWAIGPNHDLLLHNPGDIQYLIKTRLNIYEWRCYLSKHHCLSLIVFIVSTRIFSSGLSKRKAHA